MDKEVAFDFEIETHNGVLDDVVESIWYARGTVPYTQEKIAPTGSVVAIFVLGDAIEQMPLNDPKYCVRSDTGLIIGPHDGPIINRPLGETHAVGIVAEPVGCENLFGVRPSLLRGGVFALLDVWPEAKILRDQLCGLETGRAKLDAIQRFLFDKVGGRIAGLRRCKDAISQIENDPRISVTDVAENLSVSTGHLGREFARIVGLSPRTLSNIIRMRLFLSALDSLGSVDWAGLAVEHEWFDQAHFIRNFKRHTGVTPTQYVASHKFVSDVMDVSNAAGFVPEE